MEHVNIPDGERHEPKGAAFAANGELLTSNGDGSTSFKAFPEINALSQTVLKAESVVDQNPAGLDTPLQVEFGAAQAVSSVSLSANGTITILQDGYYVMTFTARASRNTGAGQAILFIRTLVDTVTGDTGAAELDDGDFTIPLVSQVEGNYTAGQEIKVQILRDSGGNNDGGLHSIVSTSAGWNTAPSARVAIQKITLGV